MKITDVRIRKIINDGSPLKAIISITIDGVLAVHDIKVIEKPTNELYLGMPSRKDESGIFRDVVHPIGQVARDKITAEILSAYNKEVQKKSSQSHGNDLESKNKIM